MFFSAKIVAVLNNIRYNKFMELYIGYACGIIWAVVNITALLLYDPANDDPEIEKLWNDNF